METTRRLELPEEIAEAVSARVVAGDFASESEVIQEGLRLLAERDASNLPDGNADRSAEIAT